MQVPGPPPFTLPWSGRRRSADVPRWGVHGGASTSAADAVNSAASSASVPGFDGGLGPGNGGASAVPSALSNGEAAAAQGFTAECAARRPESGSAAVLIGPNHSNDAIAGEGREPAVPSSKEADMAERVREGRTWWGIIHVGTVAALLCLPSPLHCSAWGLPPWPRWFAVLYGLLFCATLLQYRALTRSSPGYLHEAVSIFLQHLALPSPEQSEQGNASAFSQPGTENQGSAAHLMGAASSANLNQKGPIGPLAHKSGLPTNLAAPGREEPGAALANGVVEVQGVNREVQAQVKGPITQRGGGGSDVLSEALAVLEEGRLPATRLVHNVGPSQSAGPSDATLLVPHTPVVYGMAPSPSVEGPSETTPLLSRTPALPRLLADAVPSRSSSFALHLPWQRSSSPSTSKRRSGSAHASIGGSSSGEHKGSRLALPGYTGTSTAAAQGQHEEEDVVLLDLEGTGTGAASWEELLAGRSKRSCPYCKLCQPLRSKHCYDCGLCVLQFDHHCAWVGTCIGLRNHTAFWMYLLMDTALALWSLGMALWVPWAYPRSASFAAALGASVLSLMLIGAIVFLGTLLGFHTYLMLTNQTTYEVTRKQSIVYLRDTPPQSHPFSQGLLTNLYLSCCLSPAVLPLYLVPRTRPH